MFETTVFKISQLLSALVKQLIVPVEYKQTLAGWRDVYK